MILSTLHVSHPAETTCHLWIELSDCLNNLFGEREVAVDYWTMISI